MAAKTPDELTMKAAERYRLAQAQEQLDCWRASRVPMVDAHGKVVPAAWHAVVVGLRPMPAERWAEVCAWLAWLETSGTP